MNCVEFFQSPNPVALESSWSRCLEIDTSALNENKLKANHIPPAETIQSCPETISCWMAYSSWRQPTTFSASCSHFNSSTIDHWTCLRDLALKYIKPQMAEKMHIVRWQGLKEVSASTHFQSNTKDSMLLWDAVCAHMCEGRLPTPNYLVCVIFPLVKNTWGLINLENITNIMSWWCQKLNCMRRKASRKKTISLYHPASLYGLLLFPKHMPWIFVLPEPIQIFEVNKSPHFFNELSCTSKAI